MLAIMETYTNTLESLVDQRTTQLAEEKKKTEALLLRMLPRWAVTAVFDNIVEELQKLIYRVRQKNNPLRKLKFLENEAYFAVFFTS